MPRAKANRDKAKAIRCPRCGKKFCSETNVLQHMNQPLSLCRALYHEEHAPPLHHFSQSSQNRFTGTHGVAEMQESDYFFDEGGRWTPPGNQDDNHGDSAAFGTTADSSKFTEWYAGCSEAFPGGNTFMDFFETDQYAEERKTNLYFPFASREEWQFASWLLRSRLSLAAIDSLLSLDLVRWRFFLPLPFDEFHSSSSGFPSRFVPERSSVLERKLFLLALLGSVNQ